MRWSVETLGRVVDDEIASLPPSLQARLIRVMEMVQSVGLETLREPHVKHIEGKIWELRAKSGGGIARGLYVTALGRRLIVLHVFEKKSQKTPARALETARRRMRQVLE